MLNYENSYEKYNPETFLIETTYLLKIKPFPKLLTGCCCHYFQDYKVAHPKHCLVHGNVFQNLSRPSLNTISWFQHRSYVNPTGSTNYLLLMQHFVYFLQQLLLNCFILISLLLFPWSSVSNSMVVLRTERH